VYRDVVFLSLYVCVSVCLSVRETTQKLVDKCIENFGDVGRVTVKMGGFDPRKYVGGVTVCLYPPPNKMSHSFIRNVVEQLRKFHMFKN